MDKKLMLKIIEILITLTVILPIMIDLKIDHLITNVN